MSTTRIPRQRVGHRGHAGRHCRTALTAALAGLALCVLGSSALAAPEAHHTTSIGALALPEYIGPLEFIGEHSGPEGEHSLSYSYRAAGLALEISVTDLGPAGIADGVEAPELLERYAEAKQDVAASTPVRRLKPRYEKTVTFGARTPRMAREALFTAKKRRDQGGSTYLIFTAVHGLLIDVRFDVAPGFEEDGAISRGEILEMLGDAIPASSATVQEARTRLAAEAEAATKVAILWDPATPEQEGRIWLAYLFARAAFAVSDGSAQPVAGEREASFEEELRGRSIAVSTFRALRRNDAQLASAYFSDIDRVEAAGFLREYVWSYLRRESWQSTPAALNLAGFEAWRLTHLPDHVAVTHGRIAFRLAGDGAPRAGS